MIFFKHLTCLLCLKYQVISALNGEFENGYRKGGQTRQHVQLATTLGLKKLLVLINKMDHHTVNWSKERFSLPFVFCLYSIILKFLSANVLSVRYDEIESLMKAFLQQTGFRGNFV